jgi:hypothetical protein
MKAAFALALLAAASQAIALEHVTVHVDGSVIHRSDTSAAGKPFSGTITVTLADLADGLYTGSDLLRLSMASTIGNWATEAPAGYLRLEAGGITSFVASIFRDPCIDVHVAGGNVYVYSAAQPHVTDFAGVGKWHQDAMAPVPELETWTMLLAGMAAVGALRRRSARSGA